MVKVVSVEAEMYVRQDAPKIIFLSDTLIILSGILQNHMDFFSDIMDLNILRISIDTC